MVACGVGSVELSRLIAIIRMIGSRTLSALWSDQVLNGGNWLKRAIR
jgi:hypothetical protein